MAKINWTYQALDDLKEIAEYIGKDSKRFAKLTVSNLFEATTILESYALVGKVLSELNRNDIRVLYKANYSIVYKIVSEELIDILTVYHNKRLIENSPIFIAYKE